MVDKIFLYPPKFPLKSGILTLVPPLLRLTRVGILNYLEDKTWGTRQTR
jgi:hypothetical protein